MCCECEPRKPKSCTCGCGRRFYSSKEERERIECYRDELKKELAGVEERLSELKSE
ncbi:MAG: hypothetical protein ACYC64_03395 [Armatimonadota bacterium]